MPFFSYSIINSQRHLHENATRPSDIREREIEIDSGVVVMVKTGY